MGEMLSQAEIDALLNGSMKNDLDSSPGDEQNDLNAEEIDALGEIGNINMGTSATTLSTLLGNKVIINTPSVSVMTWEELSNHYKVPYVGVKVEYTQGLMGANLLILDENDVKIMTDIMMGGDGSNILGELNDLHLSAIGEVMNQMIGSSATSMSSLFNKKIDISPPQSFVIHFGSESDTGFFDTDEKLVKVAFKMIVGNLIDSEIMQLFPVSFAKDLVHNLINIHKQGAEKVSGEKPKESRPSEESRTQENIKEKTLSQPVRENTAAKTEHHTYDNHASMNSKNDVNEQVSIQPVNFLAFDEPKGSYEKKNIDLIMDVPLQVTVELGRTHKLIKEILEFGQGSVVELDKLAGEPVDILVNGKPIANGEVVVIDESFGVRITDIIHPLKRL